MELGGQLAEQLAARTAGRRIEIICSDFETVALRAQAFDGVFAATSFHWIDPAVGMQRAASFLRPLGWMALAWNVFGDPGRPDPFHDALHDLLTKIGPELVDPYFPGGNAADPTDWVEAIGEAGLFDDAHVDTIHWVGTHTTAELRALFATFSPWISLTDELRSCLLDQLAALADTRFGGVVSRPYRTLVVLAQKR